MGRVVNLEETTKLCKAIAVIAPAQKFEADTPAFWAAILASISYADARQAVINLGARVPFMAPADIIAEVKAIRAKRLEGVDRLGHLAETPAQWRAIIAKVADGETEVPPLAEDDAENKRAIESMMRDVFPRPPRPLAIDRAVRALPAAPTVDQESAEAMEAERERQLAAVAALVAAESPAPTREDRPA